MLCLEVAVGFTALIRIPSIYFCYCYGKIGDMPLNIVTNVHAVMFNLVVTITGNLSDLNTPKQENDLSYQRISCSGEAFMKLYETPVLTVVAFECSI